MARCSQKYRYYCSILLLVSGGREHLPCFCLCSQSCQLWSALGLHSEKKEQAKGECCLEVGHVHSAFVKSDSSINHVRGSVDAQWLRSAGGISLWMPEHQPRWSTRVPSLLVPQCFAALRRLSLQAVLAHPTPKFHQFKKMLKACSRVCPTLSSYHFFFSLPFFSVISVSFQHISPLFFFFFFKVSRCCISNKPVPTPCTDMFGVPGVFPHLTPVSPFRLLLLLVQAFREKDAEWKCLSNCLFDCMFGWLCTNVRRNTGNAKKRLRAFGTSVFLITLDPSTDIKYFCKLE